VFSFGSSIPRQSARAPHCPLCLSRGNLTCPRPRVSVYRRTGSHIQHRRLATRTEESRPVYKNIAPLSLLNYALLLGAREEKKMLFKKKDKAQSADSTVVGSEDVLQTDGANMATVPTQDVRAGEGLAPVTTTATEDIVYPGGVKLALLLGSTFISMFLVALVRSPGISRPRGVPRRERSSLTCSRTASSSRPPSRRSPTTSTP